jgi:hypothetical protein
MSEDKFFGQVKSTMEHYAPEVPASVYAGMRRKLWLSQFLRWNASRLNAWYVVLFVSIGTTAAVMTTSNNATGNKATSYSSPVEATVVSSADAINTPEVAVEQTSSAAENAVAKMTSQFSPKNIRPDLGVVTLNNPACVSENQTATVPTNTEETKEEISTQQSSEPPVTNVNSEVKPADPKKKRTLRPSVYTNGN